MSKRVFLPFVALIILIMLIGLACGKSDGTSETTPEPSVVETQPPAVVATEAPLEVSEGIFLE